MKCLSSKGKISQKFGDKSLYAQGNPKAGKGTKSIGTFICILSDATLWVHKNNQTYISAFLR